MITGLTEDQFRNLPTTSLHYPCDKCGKRRDYGSLIRDIGDYCIVEGQVIEKESHTALYLCSACQWQMSCEYSRLDKEEKRQQAIIKSNEALWLRKVSHLPVQALADRVGVSRQAYHKWLRGRAITPEHKARLKEMIAVYISEDDEDDN